MNQNFADIPRIYTALAEILAVYMYGFILKTKCSKVRLSVYAAGMLVWQSFFMIYTGNISIYWWIPVMIAAILCMYGFLCFVTSLDQRTTAYYCLRAFILAEFMASLGWQFVYFAGMGRRETWMWKWVIMAGTYVGVAAVYMYMERKITDSAQTDMISMQELVTAALVVILVFAFSNLGFLTIRTPFSGRLPADIFNVRTLVDFIGIVMLYAIQSRMHQLHSERELARMQVMLKNQYDKYKNYQESINRINRTYHDLKHDIAKLCVQMGDEEKAEWSRLILRELNYYKPDIQTGNYVLDTLIDSKMLFFKRNQITFTCVVDGELLEFLHVTDLCTIFGNALDCAIEDVYLVQDPDQRVIHLTVSEKRGFLYIFQENYSEGRQNSYEYEQKCIEYSVEKYHGTVSLKQRKDWKELQILIPMEYGKKKR